MHTKTFNNVPYLPESPVNILSANALARSMKYSEGTWILTKRKYYSFTSYFGKYKKTTAHSECVLQY